MIDVSAPWRARFWMKVRVAPADACWEWLASLDRYGYGKFAATHRTILTAHRAAFLLAGREIPEGLHLDHLCRNRACCNPSHLEPVTNAENQHRGYWVIRTHCENGHPWTEENTGLRKNHPSNPRYCRACRQQRRRRTRGLLSSPPCKYCGEVGGHTGQCPVVSTSEGETSA